MYEARVTAQNRLVFTVPCWIAPKSSNKLSYCRQIAQPLYTPMLRCPRHKMLWSTTFHAVLPEAVLRWIADLLARFSDFHLSLSHLTPSVRGIPSSYRVHSWYRKTRMAGLKCREGHVMIDSVVWVQYINMTDRQTATSPYKCRPDAVHLVSRMPLGIGIANKRMSSCYIGSFEALVDFCLMIVVISASSR